MMDTVELTQVKAMLQEIFVATHPSRRTPPLAIALIGVTKQPDWNLLKNEDELDDIVAATKKALPQMKEGKITIADSVWRDFEDVYYQRVVKPAFAEATV